MISSRKPPLAALPNVAGWHLFREQPHLLACPATAKPAVAGGHQLTLPFVSPLEFAEVVGQPTLSSVAQPLLFLRARDIG